MFYEVLRTKQEPSYILICSLSTQYDSKLILMATSLGTNAVVVMNIHCLLRKYASEISPPKGTIDLGGGRRRGREEGNIFIKRK